METVPQNQVLKILFKTFIQKDRVPPFYDDEVAKPKVGHFMHDCKTASQKVKSTCVISKKCPDVKEVEELATRI